MGLNRYLTQGDDVYLGGRTPEFDKVYGLAGDDEIHGGDAHVLVGGAGDDTLYAGQYTSMMYGGLGADTLFAGFGQKALFGGEGDDLIVGVQPRNRNDSVVLSGGGGDDHIIQGGTPSRILGGTGNDLIELSDQIAKVYAGAGDDLVIYPDRTTAYFPQPMWVRLGDGDDLLDGSHTHANSYPPRSYTVYSKGGDGNDTVIAGSGRDEFLGGSGTDEISYAFERSAVSVDLASGASGGAAEGDKWASVENATGSAFADALTGDRRANVLVGGLGDDTLSGFAGADRLIGGGGADVMSGGRGADRFVAGDQDAILDFSRRDHDVLDLTGFRDAIVGGKRPFFIDTAAFGGHAGEVRLASGPDGSLIVQGDADGDRTADFSLALENLATLSRYDILF